MKQRTLKEVAQAGLVLGFEWIAKNRNGAVYLYSKKAKMAFDSWLSYGIKSQVLAEITDYPHAPENSLLKLSEIVEGK